jgi:DNA/RNA endonuclease G (NUC1)
MAFLYYDKAQNSYKAFALWTEHLNSNNPSAATVINNRISIDELEARTGIDFFCNLPDDIEAAVEATATYWDSTSNAKERPDDDFFAPEEEVEEEDEAVEIAMW